MSHNNKDRRTRIEDHKVTKTNPLTTCVHSALSMVDGMPPLLRSTSSMCLCSSVGNPVKQTRCPSNTLSRCVTVNSSRVAMKSDRSRLRHASSTQAGRTTPSRKVIAYLYLSPPAELQIKCVTLEFMSLRMLPPIAWIRFTRRVCIEEERSSVIMRIKDNNNNNCLPVPPFSEFQ